MSTHPFPGGDERGAPLPVINHGQIAAAIVATQAEIERLETVECTACQARAATLARRREELADLARQADELAARRARAAALFAGAP